MENKESGKLSCINEPTEDVKNSDDEDDEDDKDN